MGDEIVCIYCGSTDVKTTQRECTCQKCSMRFPLNRKTRNWSRKRRRAFDEEGKANTREKQKTPKPPSNDEWRDVQVRDVITHDEDNVEIVRDTAIRMPPDSYIPELSIDSAKAEFFKWLFKDQVKKDKRYGRDYLRQNGYRIVDTVEDRGKIVKLWDIEHAMDD